MKTTDKKAIIYDNSCPMCAMYTEGFTRWGILKKENRVAFAELDTQQFIAQLDPERSRDEIPLVDLEGGKTIYGLDALLFMLSEKIPALTYIFRVQPVYWFFKKLYKLISFNRRVIVGGRYKKEKIDCAPHFNLKYRVVFMLFAAAFATWITYLFGEAVATANGTNLLPAWTAHAGWFAVAACSAGWLLHGLVAAAILKGETRIEYFGQMAVLQIIGVAPLIIAIAFQNTAVYVAAGAAVFSVLVSMALMTWQHLRRMKNNGWSAGWTLTWAGTLLASIAAVALTGRN
ncbi:MAG: hypothetical protein FD123_299 [Bacteroidetes bacterium]|nr:MAG: hypothetical protein FD123_299 [Bacteroidota bacterium]